MNRGPLLLVGGDYDQDDVELFQRLWEEHRGESQSAAGHLPPPLTASSAIRATSLKFPVKVPRPKGSPEVESVKARLAKALKAELANPWHRRS